ncbi:MAG: MerR family transcriptional regulator [Coriobacteriia bacterium]|nr:MerR family transcriptional regulator [Coriobacteriia bacterium]
MYKIGEFSKLAKTTIKTLRYYESQGLFEPAYVDDNGYRYYEADQLLDLSKLVRYRQIGLSISDIKKIQGGEDLNNFLYVKAHELQETLQSHKYQLKMIDYLRREKVMEYNPVIKEMPEYVVYCKEGIIKDFREASKFITDSANECLATNPNIKCVKPDYCFVSYLDKEHKNHDIKLRYCQAVEEAGVDNETIKFLSYPATKVISIYHKGHYDTLGEAYGFIMKYVEENGFDVTDLPREVYIDGIWNKDDPTDWLTEIQVPIN